MKQYFDTDDKALLSLILKGYLIGYLLKTQTKNSKGHDQLIKA